MDAARHPSGPLETVAHATHGLDHRGVSGIVLQLRPEPLDGHVHQAGVSQVVVVPHALEQQLAREDLPGAVRLQANGNYGNGRKISFR